MKIEDLLPYGVLAIGVWAVWKYLIPAVSGAEGGGAAAAAGGNVGVGDATPASNTGIYQALSAITTGIKSPGQPESLTGGGSWTRYGLPATEALQALVASWTPPGAAPLVAVQSGRDQPLAGQVAVYNPATGNAWGGEVGTVEWLYASADPAAAAWRARYG